MSKGVLVLAEQRDGAFRKVAYEVVSEGRRLADQLSTELAAVVIGSGIEGIAPTLGKYGADRVLVADEDAFKFYSAEGYTRVLAEIINTKGPSIVLLPASALGKDLAPKLAARLKLGLASECTQLFITEGRLEAKRPVYAGKAFIRVRFETEPQLATLRPNVFPIKELDQPKSPSIEKVETGVSPTDLGAIVKEIIPAPGGRVDLSEADVVVSGGRGMKGPENFKLLEELADLLGGAVGASRAAVDAGWRPHSDQVGQTGKVVTPSLYIACGISGAIQHLAGMSSSKCIVAINKDPDAPIFQRADYGIVGDLFEVVPALIEEIKKLRK